MVGMPRISCFFRGAEPCNHIAQYACRAYEYAYYVYNDAEFAYYVAYDAYH